MHICYVAQDLTFGGAQRQLTYLSAELVRRGHRVSVLTIGGGVFRDALVEAGVDLRVAGSADAPPEPGIHNYHPAPIARLAAELYDARPDVVQTWMVHSDLVAGAACTLARIPWVMRESSSPDAADRGVKGRCRRILARHASYIVANSAPGYAFWRRSAPGVPSKVIANGVAVEAIRRAKAVAQSAEWSKAGRKVVLFAGRLEEAKNIRNTALAFRRALDTSPEAAVIVCGDGSLQAAVREILAGHLASGRAQLTGAIPNVWEYMKAASLFVSASTYEGCPNSVIEAMACGVPVLVSDIPAHRAFLNEEVTEFVPVDDPEAVGDRIVQALNDPRTPIRSRRATEAAERFAIGASADAYEEVYDAAVAGPRCRTPRGLTTENPGTV